jgi:hypothetical protein
MEGMRVKKGWYGMEWNALMLMLWQLSNELPLISCPSREDGWRLFRIHQSVIEES